jgi:hypothetical protein
MTKTKERQRKVTSQAKHNSTLKTARKLPPEHMDANFQILAHLF